jgi:hypothetical protein
MIKNKGKQFDCIKMKNNIQEQVYAETHNMSKEELLSYFNKNYARYTPSVNHPLTCRNEALFRQTGR